MKKKGFLLFYYLRCLLLIAWLATFSADTTKTSKKADNPLIEDEYDVDADTVMGYYGSLFST